MVLSQQPGFEHIFRQRFDIEGHAISLSQNRLLHLRRQGFPSGHRCHEFGALPSRKPAERQGRHVTIVRPHRLEIGAACDQQQHAHLPDAVNDARHEIQRGGIEPMDIFDDEQQGAAIGQLLQMMHQRFQCHFLACFGRHVERGIPMIAPDREQIRKQCHRVLPIDSAIDTQDLELAQLRLGAVLTRQSSGLPQKTDRRIERSIRMVRGTLKLHPPILLIGETVTQTTDHSRFSNTGLPTQEHDLPFAFDGFAPATQQECRSPLLYRRNWLIGWSDRTQTG